MTTVSFYSARSLHLPWWHHLPSHGLRLVTVIPKHDFRKCPLIPFSFQSLPSPLLTVSSGWTLSPSPSVLRVYLFTIILLSINFPSDDFKKQWSNLSNPMACGFFGSSPLHWSCPSWFPSHNITLWPFSRACQFLEMWPVDEHRCMHLLTDLTN